MEKDNKIENHLITIYDNGKVTSYGVPFDENNHAYYLLEYMKENHKDSKVTATAIDGDLTINIMASLLAYSMNIATFLNVRTTGAPELLAFLPQHLDENLKKYMLDNSKSIDEFSNIVVSYPDIVEIDNAPTLYFKSVEINKSKEPEETVQNIIGITENLFKSKSKKK